MESQQGARRDSADVGRNRERRRQRRLLRIAVLLAPVAVYLWYRLLTGDPVSGEDFALPVVDPLYLVVGLFFLVMIGVLLAQVVVSGRSPHLVYRPEQIDVSLDDVKGLGPVKEEVQRSLDLFLAGRTFRREMGGTPRRGLLFEGPPGTGKTHMAKAMAREAGVPFLYVSGTSFQSMYYGATARRIRSYFRALRRAARAEGGAIGFIEEIDAIATVRHGMPMAPAGSLAAPASASAVVCCGGLEGLPGQVRSTAGVASHGAPVVSAMGTEGVGGVVNELLVQMQSFDEPTGAQQLLGKLVDAVNLLLPAHRQLPRPKVEPVDVLLIAATNRADSLDPALLRPGRFDRRLTFDAPDQRGRREVLDHFLSRKAHEAELDDDERRDALAGITAGSTPVMIENLLDEALVNAVRRGASAMSWKDVEHARLVTSVGLGSPVGYTAREARLIATHEAGHAVVAHLVAPQRRLEVLTIIKRAGALGLLAHGDAEEVWTRSRSELVALVQIAFGGQVAEELAFGDVSTGPSSDLAYATRIGAQMVGSAGMAGSLVSFAAAEASPVGEGLVGRVLGDASARGQLEELLGAQREAVRALLGANTHLVAALRDALLERHELIGHEITDVLAAAGPAVVVSGVSAGPVAVVLPATGPAAAPTVGA
ncbi:AAA family ATPase [Streptomyces sp. NP160]|uniref:AAA family ATPase n=1 Tax=Streptomyces sp. NP160 TaxID=2586637 RepID=UPI00111A86F8|nr:AAA family ATPase [Streptomyces sp. NP160]TNM68587.1 AAA family ATPase [Streptomyces sp. NP160]